MAAPPACRLLPSHSGLAAAAAAFVGAPVLPTAQRRPPPGRTARHGPAAAGGAPPWRRVASMGSSPPPAPAPAGGRNLLVTFDLDGTLLRSASPGGNRAHKLALERSMVAALAGTPHALAAPPSIDGVPHAGSTDPLIVEAVLAAAGVPPPVVARALPAILDGATATIDAVMAEEAARAGGGGGGVPTVLPGVVDLLTALRSAGVAVGLVTGNLEGIAWAKVRAVGLGDYFGGGGYGSDAPDRGVFLATAMRRVGTGGWATGFRLVESPPLPAAAAAGGEPPLVGAPRPPPPLPRPPPPPLSPLSLPSPPRPRYANVVHVGDAPTDMQAAVAAGARGLGVTTGVFGASTLWAAGATEVLDGLADTRRVLNVLGV